MSDSETSSTEIEIGTCEICKLEKEITCYFPSGQLLCDDCIYDLDRSVDSADYYESDSSDSKDEESDSGS